jgi:hypothetical protein
MINIGSSIFQANAIFLQPSWACAKQCPGCYSKERETQFGSDEASIGTWETLIQNIKKQNGINSNQITFALDALPTNRYRNRMANIAFKYFDCVGKHKTNTEFHITTNHINDLNKYTEYYDEINNLDLLSISNILSVDQINLARLEVPGAKINWNVTSGDFVKQVKRQGLEQVKKIVRKVDSVYLLLHKAPMGLQGHDLNGFFDGLEVLKQFDNIESVEANDAGEICAVPSLSRKFNLDGCMNDARKFNKSGKGCSSNISRFQIWPDGRVTGCAYNSHNQYGKFANNFEDIIDNLWDAKFRYEFATCSIPKALNNFAAQKHKPLQVIA